MKSVRLKDLGRWYCGGTPPRAEELHWSGDLPWLSAKDIDSARLRKPTTFITEEAARSHSRVVPAGTLLIIVRGMALAHGLPVVRTHARSAFNQDLRGLVCGPGIDSRFIQHALIGNRWRLNAHIDRAAHGTQRVTDSIFSERIQVPSIGAQRSTADFLDRECARIDELLSEIRLLERAEIEALESLRERILTRCGSSVRLKYGLSSCLDTAHATCPQVDGGSHLVIRTTGVRHGTLDTAGCYSTDDTSFAAWTRRRVPQPGDIVFTREAPAGEAAVIPSHGSWALGQRSVLLVPDRRRLDPDFVVFALYGRAVGEEIILRARSTTAAHLNVREIGELPIPMPSVERQIEAASEFANARLRFSGLRSETSAVSATLNEYRHALITEAVTGKLDVTKVSESQMHESLEAAQESEAPEVLA